MVSIAKTGNCSHMGDFCFLSGCLVETFASLSSSLCKNILTRVPAKKGQGRAEMHQALFQMLPQVTEPLSHADSSFMNNGDNRDAMYF